MVELPFRDRSEAGRILGLELATRKLQQNYLAQLAEETGGESYMLGFGPPVALAPYLDEIAARLQDQYRITFLIKPENKGGLREVKFSTEVPNAELVAAVKLYVPGSREERGK
jgi:hypothetical protein